MATRWLLVLLFLAGTLLGLALRAEETQSTPVWAGPLAPIFEHGDVGLALRIAPAVNGLLLFPQQNQVFLPLIQSQD